MRFCGRVDGQVARLQRGPEPKKNKKEKKKTSRLVKVPRRPSTAASCKQRCVNVAPPRRTKKPRKKKSPKNRRRHHRRHLVSQLFRVLRPPPPLREKNRRPQSITDAEGLTRTVVFAACCYSSSSSSSSAAAASSASCRQPFDNERSICLPRHCYLVFISLFFSTRSFFSLPRLVWRWKTSFHNSSALRHASIGYERSYRYRGGPSRRRQRKQFAFMSRLFFLFSSFFYYYYRRPVRSSRPSPAALGTPTQRIFRRWRAWSFFGPLMEKKTSDEHRELIRVVRERWHCGLMSSDWSNTAAASYLSRNRPPPSSAAVS